MSTSGDLNAVLNQLLQENMTLKLVLLSVLRDKPVEDLNRYMKEASIRTQMAVKNSHNQDGVQNIKKAELEAISMLNTLIAEKNSSL